MDGSRKQYVYEVPNTVDILRPQLFYYHDGKVISSYDPYFLKSSTLEVIAR
jgi:hypothetical protein